MPEFKKGDKVRLRSPFDDVEFETELVYEVLGVEFHALTQRAHIRFVVTGGEVHRTFVSLNRLVHVSAVDRLGELSDGR